MGLYGTFAKGEFDSYYSTLVMVLLNIVLDDVASPQLCPGTNLPILPARGSEVKNLKAASMLVPLLTSASVGLNSVALRVGFASVRLHAPNVAVLEVLGVVSALVEKLLAIVFCASLDVSLLAQLFSPQEGDHGESFAGKSAPRDSGAQAEEISGPSSDSSPPTVVQHSAEVLCAVLSEVVLLLQIVATATANRDHSVPVLLAAVLQHASTCVASQLHAVSRCQNCDLELACLQCLNDGYVCPLLFFAVSSFYR
jgi:hypothetical protein